MPPKFDPSAVVEIMLRGKKPKEKANAMRAFVFCCSSLIALFLAYLLIHSLLQYIITPYSVHSCGR